MPDNTGLGAQYASTLVNLRVITNPDAGVSDAAASDAEQAAPTPAPPAGPPAPDTDMTKQKWVDFYSQAMGGALGGSGGGILDAIMLERMGLLPPPLVPPIGSGAAE